MPEVEEISGAPEVSVPGWRPAATRHFMGAGLWHLLAWLSLLCFSPGLGSWGHLLLITAFSCGGLSPSGGSGTRELRQGVVLPWVGSGFLSTVDWLVCWH